MAEEMEQAAYAAKKETEAREEAVDKSKATKLQLHLQSKIKDVVKLKKAFETLAQIKKRFGR